MPRDFQIFGETMIQTSFGAHVPAVSGGQIYDLGLAQSAMVWTPNFRHRDILTDSYGPMIPADTIWYMGDAIISFDLIHWDPDTLDLCVEQAAAGGTGAAGAMATAGSLMGAGLPLGASGNFYIGLLLTSSRTAQGQQPYHFPAAYLTGPFMQFPVGTQASVARLRWRAIPYSPLIQPTTGKFDVQPDGAILWDRQTG